MRKRTWYWCIEEVVGRKLVPKAIRDPSMEARPGSDEEGEGAKAGKELSPDFTQQEHRRGEEYSSMERTLTVSAVPAAKRSGEARGQLRED